MARACRTTLAPLLMNRVRRLVSAESKAVCLCRSGAEKAVAQHGASIALACRTFVISETCYRYSPLLRDENEHIADLWFDCPLPDRVFKRPVKGRS